MTDDGEQASCQQLAVAIAVAADVSVFREETWLQLLPDVWGKEGRRTDAPQETAHGRQADGCVDAAMPRHQQRSVGSAHEAAARVVADIGALRRQLFFIDRDDITVAGIEEGRQWGACC